MLNLKASISDMVFHKIQMVKTRKHEKHTHKGETFSAAQFHHCKAVLTILPITEKRCFKQLVSKCVESTWPLYYTS